MMAGLAWLPDGEGLVYASSRGSTVPYLAPLGLWEVGLSDGVSRRITPVETSYEQPDVHATGLISAVRMQMRFDVYQIPFGPVPADNVRRAVSVTRQTGRVLTPTAAPNGREVAYLSDSGGHANLWVTSADGGSRQITFEDDPAVAVGVPVWSPDGQTIAFVSSKGNTGLAFGVWLVKPDGREPRQLLPRGLGVAWSPDSQWLYYVEGAGGPLKKIAATGAAPPVTVRPETVRNVIGVHDSTVYYMVERMLIDGRLEFEIIRAPVDGGPAEKVWVVPPSRIAPWQIMNPSLSPDGRWLALPLTDGSTTNIWALSTADRHLQQVTDYGDRHIFIARRVSWSADGKSLFAAIGEGDADIVSLLGIVEGSPAGAASRP
jgi:Tol biopolymer transport system component